MMEKEKLKKADLLTSLLIVLFGLFICSQAFKMPMKDSWGGVQNVWYVSPALFPLLIGTVLTILGVSLFSIALNQVGAGRIKAMIREFRSREWISLSDPGLRFAAICSYFIFFVYLTVARVDFVLSSLLFLTVFIQTFYLDQMSILKRVYRLYLLGSLFFILYFALGLDRVLSRVVPFPGDILHLGFILLLCLRALAQIKGQLKLAARFKVGLIISLAVSLILGPAFKYFLRVPLPCEGMVMAVLDYIWYTIL